MCSKTCVDWYLASFLCSAQFISWRRSSTGLLVGLARPAGVCSPTRPCAVSSYLCQSCQPRCAVRRAGYFLTKIFHPNVAKGGEICVNVLKRDWARDLGLRHVLLVVRCLLVEPFPESALNEEASKLLLESYEDYARHAALMTSIHAQPAKRCGTKYLAEPVKRASCSRLLEVPQEPLSPLDLATDLHFASGSVCSAVSEP